MRHKRIIFVKGTGGSATFTYTERQETGSRSRVQGSRAEGEGAGGEGGGRKGEGDVER